MITVFTNSGLIKGSEAKDIKDVGISDIRFAIKPIEMSDAALYIDYELKLVKILKWRWKPEFDINGIYSITDLPSILNDALTGGQGIGMSSLRPGTKKYRK